MPEFDVKITLKPPEKTFRIEANNSESAKEGGIDAFSFWLLDSQKDIEEILTVEIHHIEA